MLALTLGLGHGLGEPMHASNSNCTSGCLFALKLDGIGYEILRASTSGPWSLRRELVRAPPPKTGRRTSICACPCQPWQ